MIFLRSENLLPIFFRFLDFILCQLQTPFMHITQLYRKHYYPSVQGKSPEFSYFILNNLSLMRQRVRPVALWRLLQGMKQGAPMF
ncbi:hypothetical protein MSWHS_0310 [Methanosarcina sp. WWM596]|nr:hypothetical protein MSWHS_0310 [Methanosarcina sp. WWM596]AKB20579.1 hypothetical protein MSWH1_0308 [Methanosarcina sp. WH1]